MALTGAERTEIEIDIRRYALSKGWAAICEHQPTGIQVELRRMVGGVTYISDPVLCEPGDDCKIPLGFFDAIDQQIESLEKIRQEFG